MGLGLLGLLFLAGTLGCEGPRRELPLDNATLNAGLDPSNPRILALVDYFADRGVQLVHDRGGWWRVTRPTTPGLDVRVSLRSFPESVSTDQMRDALTRINLAYQLNPQAHLAMSYPPTDPRVAEVKARLENLFQEYRPASPGATAQWKSIVYAYRSGVTGAGSLRARTSDLIHLKSPRQVALRAVFRYEPAADAWARMALDSLPSVTLRVASPRQIYSAESDPVLLTIPQPVGLFWAIWEEDGHRLTSAVYAGRLLCEDVMLGPAPPGHVALCVPFADRAEARFVPDPSGL